MRTLLAGALGAAALALAGTAAAQPALEIRRAAVRVIVIPEDRTDVQVTVLKTNPKLPIYIERLGDRTVIDGRLLFWMSNCDGEAERFRVGIFGKGDFTAAELPQVLVRMPLDARVAAGGAAVGSIGRSRSLVLHNGGCGGWTVANVERSMEVHNSGSGRVRAGSAGSADVDISGSGDMKIGVVRERLEARVSGSGVIEAGPAGVATLVVSGSGDVRTGAIASGLEARISGSGNLDVSRVDGPFSAVVSGVGHIRAPEGRVTLLEARISGAGDVDFGGVAQTLDASVSGSGDVRAAQVTGEVTRHVSGSGEVRVGN